MRTHARRSLWLVMALLLMTGLTGCYRSVGGSLEPTESSLNAGGLSQPNTPLPESFPVGSTPTEALTEPQVIEEPTAEQMTPLPEFVVTERPTLPPAPTSGPSPTGTNVVAIPDGQGGVSEGQMPPTAVAMFPTFTLTATFVPPTAIPTNTPIPTDTPLPTETPRPTFAPPPSFTPSFYSAPGDEAAPGGEAIPLAERPTETLSPGDEFADGQGGFQPTAIAQIPTLTANQMTATAMIAEYNMTQAALQGTFVAPPGQQQPPAGATLPPAGQEVVMMTPTPTTAVVAGQCGSHLIAPGETLYRIALTYNVTANQIAIANNIVNPNLILAGDTLAIPCPQPATGNETTTTTTTTTTAANPGTYLVEPGDNIYRISLRFGVSMASLMQVNGLTPATINTIYAGQQLVIPAN